jgi:hypothetical protein
MFQPRLPQPLVRRRTLVVALSLALLGVPHASAQQQSLFPNPQLPQPQLPSNLKAGEGVIVAQARYSRDAGGINGGLHWRIYSDKPDQNGVFRMLKEDSSPQPTFVLPAGGYILHAAFGLASTAKPIQVGREPVREVFEIPGGGLRVEGRVGNAKIPHSQISFDIYKGSQFEQSERRPLATSVGTGDVVLLPEGTYYILSKYGDGNAVVRSDIRVQAGKLTDIIVTHRAAQIMFKLVNRRGGCLRGLSIRGSGSADCNLICGCGLRKRSAGLSVNRSRSRPGISLDGMRGCARAAVAHATIDTSASGQRALTAPAPRSRRQRRG